MSLVKLRQTRDLCRESFSRLKDIREFHQQLIASSAKLHLHRLLFTSPCRCVQLWGEFTGKNAENQGGISWDVTG
jgi:hypothetical protein